MLRRSRSISSTAVRAMICMVAITSGSLHAAGQKLPPREEPIVSTRAPAAPSGGALSAQEFSRAQAAAQKILAGAEFQRQPPTLWDIIKEKIGEALVRAFVGIDRVTTKSPWMGRALEWMLFVAAAVGLIVWGLRAVQRQRLRVALGGAPLKTAERARERDDWWRLSEVEAARGAWREAIHAVYWAAIIHLENRRAWRHNPARTPREYVRLLKPGSVEQLELRRLTGALETNWYGRHITREEEYQAARESFERLAAGAESSASTGGVKLAGDRA